MEIEKRKLESFLLEIDLEMITKVGKMQTLEAPATLESEESSQTQGNTVLKDLVITEGK